MPFRIIRDDISRVAADAIVCSASPIPTVGGSGEAAIHAAAGPGLLRARERFGRLQPGAAVATKAYGLHAKYVIHAIGPQWIDGRSNEVETLHRCYRNAICTAISMGCKSAAFPLICAGARGFTKSEALHVALWEFQCFAEEDIELILVVYDREAYRLSTRREAEVAAYIDDKYVDEDRWTRNDGGTVRLDDHDDEDDLDLGSSRYSEIPWNSDSYGDAAPYFSEDVSRAMWDPFEEPEEPGERAPKKPKKAPKPQAKPKDAAKPSPFRKAFGFRRAQRDESSPASIKVDENASLRLWRKAGSQGLETRYRRDEAGVSGARREAGKKDLEARMRELDAGFSETLLRLIDETGCTDAEIYKRANVSRKLFSKIRGAADYRPSKPTALAFCVALHMKPAEARELLARAGYALSHSSRMDVIVEYFLENGNYDIIEINEALFRYDQPLLGSA